MSNTLLETLAIHAGQDKPGNLTSTRAVPVNRTPSKLAKLSVAALLVGASAIYAEDIPVVNAGGTKISLYGFLQANAVYEDGNGNDNENWTEKVLSKAQDGEGRFTFNVNQTRIGFNLSGPSGNATEVTGKFESDFVQTRSRTSNAAGLFRIRQSYGQVKFKDLGLTVLFGQTADLIAPLGAPTINQGGLRHQGSLGTRRPQLRLTQGIGPVEIAVAATEDKASQPVLPGFQGSLKGKIPAVWAGEKQNVELILSGHYAAEESAAKDSAEVKAKDADGWGTPSSWSGVASLSLPVISIINLSGELFYGQNLNNYNNGSIGLSGTTTGGKKDEGIQSLGYWGAATIKLPAGFSLAGGIGLETIDKNREKKSTVVTNKDGTVTTTLNPNKNTVIFGNLKYNVAETAFIGFEYANLKTDYASIDKDKKVDSGKLNRFELVFNYAFK